LSLPPASLLEGEHVRGSGFGRFVWLAVLSLAVFSLAACDGDAKKASSSAKPAMTTARPASAVRVGLATNQFNAPFSEAAVRAVQKATNDFGIHWKNLASKPGETEEIRQDRLRELAKEGYNPVIVVGTIYTYALDAVAKEFPKTRFAFVDSGVLDEKNVTALLFDEQQGAFLVGTIAAQASKTKRIGFIGGTPGPILVSIARGFEDGAKAVRRDVKVTKKFVSTEPGGFDDPGRAKTVATDLIGAGNDVLYTVAFNSNPGVFDAAARQKKLAIGMDSDQYLTAAASQKPAILTSVVKQVDTAVYAMIKSAVDGAMLTGDHTFDVKNGGITYATSNPQVRPYEATANQYEQKLISGAVKVRR
jgi:basic membrane protein A